MFFPHPVPPPFPSVSHIPTPEPPSLAAKNKPGPAAPVQLPPPLPVPPPLAPPQPASARAKRPSAASRVTRRMESPVWRSLPVSISISPSSSCAAGPDHYSPPRKQDTLGDGP